MTELIKIQRNLEKEAWPESKTNQQIWNSMILSQKVLHWPINSSKKQTSNLPIKYTRTELMQTPVITQVNEGKKVSPRKHNANEKGLVCHLLQRRKAWQIGLSKSNTIDT